MHTYKFFMVAYGGDLEFLASVTMRADQDSPYNLKRIARAMDTTRAIHIIGPRERTIYVKETDGVRDAG